ncbi:MAG TPA: hypothetical protein VK604_18045 [Bryobacteraceae bacterium]|nr:hypothetical protein [Bryobacteraceae bacterium]
MTLKIHYLIGLLFAASALAQAPTPVGVQFQHISHSSVAVVFGASSAPGYVRLRYGLSSCAGGSGQNLQVGTISVGNLYTAGNSMNLAGLAPNTLYHVCVELSNNNATWSSGSDATFTTAPLPAEHPAKPVPPMTFDTSYPDTAGFATYTLASDCSDIGTAYTAAVARQLSQGTVINIPPGTLCNTGPYFFGILPPDVFTFLPSAVNTGNGQITIPSHGLSEGDLIHFAHTYRSLTTYPSSTSCPNVVAPGVPGGIQTGQRYKAHVIDANHLQVTCLDGVTLMSFTTQGSSTTGGFYMVPWKKVNGQWTTRLKPIIVRSAAPDSELPPPGVDITPAWQSKMASFVDPVTNLASCGSPSPASAAFIVFGDSDDNYERPIGNIRIGPGIQITTVDSIEAHQSSDPVCWGRILTSYTWDHNIVFDRIYFHGQGTPNRLSSAWYWNGSNMAAIDSYWDNLVYFHASTTGLAVAKISGTKFTIATGNSNPGTGPINLNSAVTGTISGSGSGEILLGFDLAHGNAFTAWAPSGVSVSCAGVACASGVAGTQNGTCNTSDGWPRNSKGDPTAAIVGCVNVSAGAISSVLQAFPGYSAYNNEGCSFMMGGIGPGPYVLEGNYFEGAGLILHFDDGGGYGYRGDYTVYRNYFHSPLKYLGGNASNGNTLSDGLYYYIRQFLEWKGGQRQKIIGNVFNTTWKENNPTGLFIVETPRLGGYVTDVEEADNTFMHGPGLTANPYAICANNSAPCAPPAVRFWFHNNLAWDINGWKYAAYNPNPATSGGPGIGWVLGGGGEATEDAVWDHNTFFNQLGAFPVWLDWDEYPSEGFTFTNNIFGVTGIPTQRSHGTLSGNIPVQNCANTSDKAFMDCAFTSGPGNPSYNFAGNVIMGLYTDASATPNGQITAGTIGTLFGSLVNTNSVVSGANVPATIGSMKWFNNDITSQFPDFHLRHDSAYIAGNNPRTKTADAGVNMEVLNASQGLVTLIGVPGKTITTSAATIAYVAPDSGTCYVDYSSTDSDVIASFSRTVDSGGARTRNVALSSLSSGTTYFYRVECRGNARISQQMGQFKTR